MKLIKYITRFLNWAFILILLLFCLDVLSVLEIKHQEIKEFVYWKAIILPLPVFLWNLLAIKPIRKKLLFLVLPLLSFIGIMVIGRLPIAMSTGAWHTQRIIYQNGHLPFKKVEFQMQDVGALGYNRRTVEVTYLTNLFMLINPVNEDIESRIEWVKVDKEINELGIVY